jgi:hypothetical protein
VELCGIGSADRFEDDVDVGTNASLIERGRCER